MALPFDVEELEGSPILEVDDEGIHATRVFRVPQWESWRAFAGALLGRYELLGGQVVYEPPAVFPGFSNLFVQRIRVEPMDPANPRGRATLEGRTAQYPECGARVTAEYRTAYDGEGVSRLKLPRVSEGTYITYQANTGVEFEATPSRLWQWDDGSNEPLPDDVRPQVVRPQSVHVVTWHRVLNPPFGLISQMRGYVNEGEMFGAAAETVLFAGAQLTRQFHFVDNGGFWRVRYTFIESTKPFANGMGVGGWNHFAKRAGGGGEIWTAIKRVNSAPARAAYLSADFTRLFQMGE